MDTTIQQALPQRYTEASFRFWEPVIADIVRAHPALTLLDPTKLKGRRRTDTGHLSFETASQRLRDAMLSLATYHWPSDVIKSHLFDRIYPSLRLAQRPPYILVGTKEAIARYDAPDKAVPTVVNAITSTTSEAFDLTNVNFDIDINAFRLLCVLQHHRLLSRPLRLRVGGLSLANVVQQYDVDVEEAGDGIIVLR